MPSSGPIPSSYNFTSPATMSTLAPASTSSAASATMNSPSSASSDSVSDSGRSSPNSSNSQSPLVTFDQPFDACGRFSFLETDAHSRSVAESSADDSVFSSAPSSHDSPVGSWSPDAATKNSIDPLWQQSDFASISLDGFNSMENMEYTLGFDSMLFPNDSLFSMENAAATINSGTRGELPYSSNFGPEEYHLVPSLNANDRRSSATSSSTSSGSSRSPLSEHAQASTGSILVKSDPAASTTAPLPDQLQFASDQLMDELAARARQVVGLTMALPFRSNAPSEQDNNYKQQEQYQHSLESTSPSLNMTSHSVAASFPTPAATTTVTRTKTSHTTIERRYRTNLNARIQSLRAAVPALRVLEVKAGNRVGNLALKAGTRRVGVDPDATPGQEDVIDERGYIDGVKVARKGSKANVLGKAVEYIQVLKRREMRLKREQEGMKALVRSLVGGPELVQQWETMWRERFGGPEKDEVNGDEGDADDENDDGEDEDFDDKEDREGNYGGGKKRKRAKVDSTSSAKGKGKKPPTPVAVPEDSAYSQAGQPIPIMSTHSYASPTSAFPLSIPAQPEKRKRGRPRKVPLPPTASSVNPLPSALAASFPVQVLPSPPLGTQATMDERSMQVDPAAVGQTEFSSSSDTRHQPTQQYLLAAFAFFSFFNSPLSFSASSSWSKGHTSHAHTHSGSVLGDPLPGRSTTMTSGPTFGWRDVAQITHFAVSILLLLSIILPWFPRLAKFIPRLLRPIVGVSLAPTESPSAVSDDNHVDESEKEDALARDSLLSALRKGCSLPPAIEAQLLRDTLGLGNSTLGLILSLTRQIGSPGKSKSRFGLERRMLEQKTFLRFAELVALDANTSMTTRIQTYLFASKFFSVFSASVKDVSTLALVIRPLWRAKASSLWALALSRAQGRSLASSPHVCKAYELYVLESMTVDEAARKVSNLDHSVRRVSGSADSIDLAEENELSVYDEAAGPLAVLARQSIREVIRAHAELVFSGTVTGEDIRETGTSGDDSAAVEREMRRIVEAGRSLDERTAALVDAFEQICNPTSARFTLVSLPDLEEFEAKSSSAPNGLLEADAEHFALLRSIMLYRRIFPSTLINASSCAGAESAVTRGAPKAGVSVFLTPMPSPPPSPSRRDAALHLSLRRCLDSSAFDRSDALEDARDRVVDMLTAESSGWPKRLQY